MRDVDKPTTVSLYVSDLLWLQARQREIMARLPAGEAKRYVPMPDVIHTFIEAVQRAEEGA